MMELHLLLAEMKSILEVEGTVNPFDFFKDMLFVNDNYDDLADYINDELFAKFDPITDYETALAAAFKVTEEAYYHALAHRNKKLAAGLLCNLYILKYVELSGPLLVKYQSSFWILQFSFDPLRNYIDSCLR